MNKVIYVVTIATVMMFGCSKEKINDKLSKSISPEFSITNNINLITLNDGNGTYFTMLEFSSTNEYDETVLSLEGQMDLLDDQFVNQYNHLNDSLLNEKEEEVGFNTQQPLIDFENSLNFTNSMRQTFVVEEENWMNNTILDPETDPSNIYTFGVAKWQC